ncbi:MAG TPA: hypothetical protein VJL29_13800, partial [Thermoguttaceae bacterium]|nr:hypothetical protein [Thermoguttaceae bacterium]
LAAVEAALASLCPAPLGVDRDRLMFLAGSASARRGRRQWLWPAATAATTLLAVGLATMLVFRPTSPLVGPIAGAANVHGDCPNFRGEAVENGTVPFGTEGDRHIVRPADDRKMSQPPARERFQPIRADYLVLRQKVLSEGVDALPPFPSAAATSGPTLRAGSGRTGSIDDLFDG